MMRRKLNLESLEAREVPAAKLQFIHNSPFAAVKSIDVYVNDNLLLHNFEFQTATAFLDVASQTNLKIDITSSTAGNDTNPLATATLNLADNSVTVAVAVGDPSGSGNAALHLATASAHTAATNANNTEILTLNGSPDTASIDLRVHGLGKVGDGLAFGQFSTAYQSVSPSNYIADATSGGGGIPLTTAKLDLTNSKGEAAVLMTTGFRDPAEASDPGLALLAVFDDGTSETFSPQVDAAYAAGTVTAEGGSAILSSANGATTMSVIAYPGATSSPRVASADFNGDGVPDLIAGTGPGLVGTVRIFDGKTGTMLQEIVPFGNFTGGVNVAVGDITGDGVPDYVLSPDDGGGPRVRVFNGKTNEQIADFFGIDDVDFRGGARAAIGDLNHDGKGDLIVSAGIGGGPRVAVFDGSQLTATGGPKFTGDFFAFEPELRNGAFLAAGDVNGDGYADLIVGGGPGGGPRVRVFDGKTLTASNQLSILADFFVGDVNDHSGARIAAKDMDGDGRADIITGGGPGAAPTRIFLASGLPKSGNGIAAIATGSFDGEQPMGEVFVG
jgi:hypothetical protein